MTAMSPKLSLAWAEAAHPSALQEGKRGPQRLTLPTPGEASDLEAAALQGGEDQAQAQA